MRIRAFALRAHLRPARRLLSSLKSAVVQRQSADPTFPAAPAGLFSAPANGGPARCARGRCVNETGLVAALSREERRGRALDRGGIVEMGSLGGGELAVM